MIFAPMNFNMTYFHTLPSPLLIRISKEISNGKLIWALAWLNEYTDNKSCFYQTIIKQVQVRLKTERKYQKNLNLVTKMLSGKTFNKLNQEEKEQILNLKEKNIFHEGKLTLNKRKKNNRRKTIFKRNQSKPNFLRYANRVS